MDKYDIVVRVATLLIFVFAIQESIKAMINHWCEFRADRQANRLRLIRCVKLATLVLVAFGPGLYYGLEVVEYTRDYFASAAST